MKQEDNQTVTLQDVIQAAYQAGYQQSQLDAATDQERVLPLPTWLTMDMDKLDNLGIR